MNRVRQWLDGAGKSSAIQPGEHPPGRDMRGPHEIEHVDLAPGCRQPRHPAQKLTHGTIVQMVHQGVREHTVEMLIGKDRLVGDIADHPAPGMP